MATGNTSGLDPKTELAITLVNAGILAVPQIVAAIQAIKANSQKVAPADATALQAAVEALLTDADANDDHVIQQATSEGAV